MKNYDEIYSYWNSSESSKVKDYLVQSDLIKENKLEMWPDEFFLRDFVLPGMSGKTCLEVGSGPGRMVRHFVNAGVVFTASDFSESFIPELQILSSDLDFNVSYLDITNEALVEKFDLVFCTQVLLHIHPSMIDRAIGNLIKMANDKIIIITWQDQPPFSDCNSNKTQSFNHDYLALFDKYNTKLYLELDIYFENKNRKRVKNKIYYFRLI